MAHIPKPDDVKAYLAQYQIESVIEEAVNDAVLKQVKVSDPQRGPRYLATEGAIT